MARLAHQLFADVAALRVVGRLVQSVVDLRRQRFESRWHCQLLEDVVDQPAVGAVAQDRVASGGFARGAELGKCAFQRIAAEVVACCLGNAGQRGRQRRLCLRGQRTQARHHVSQQRFVVGSSGSGHTHELVDPRLLLLDEGLGRVIAR